jgi:hypothetical protein
VFRLFLLWSLQVLIPAPLLAAATTANAAVNAVRAASSSSSSNTNNRATDEEARAYAAARVTAAELLVGRGNGFTEFLQSIYREVIVVVAVFVLVVALLFGGWFAGPSEAGLSVAS